MGARGGIDLLGDPVVQGRQGGESANRGTRRALRGIDRTEGLHVRTDDGGGGALRTGSGSSASGSTGNPFAAL